MDAFARKRIDGKNLYKRVHGVGKEIAANADDTIEFIIPYNQVKITGVEIIGADIGDYCTFEVYDNSAGTISTVPNLLLNTFGFNVYPASDYYEHKSEYAADMILGMKIKIQFHNSVGVNKFVGVNFILNELK